MTAGEAVLALVLNGLGFVSRPLYLTPAFFETKPVGALIRERLTEEDLNEFVLGRALDDLYEAGLYSLFLRVASRAVGLGTDEESPSLPTRLPQFHADGRIPLQ
jgi:transposase